MFLNNSKNDSFKTEDGEQEERLTAVAGFQGSKELFLDSLHWRKRKKCSMVDMYYKGADVVEYCPYI